MDVKEIRFTVPSDHPCFPMHFPGNPIVPGALLTQWILDLVFEHFDHLTLRELSSIKFLQTLRPASECRLELTENSDKLEIRFICWHDDEQVAKGRLIVDGK